MAALHIDEAKEWAWDPIFHIRQELRCSLNGEGQDHFQETSITPSSGFRDKVLNRLIEFPSEDLRSNDDSGGERKDEEVTDKEGTTEIDLVGDITKKCDIKENDIERENPEFELDLENAKGGKSNQNEEQPLIQLVMNNLFKGLLFVQETYETSSIDHFYERYPERYKMLFARGLPDDQIIFQGSSSEGIAIHRIDECDEQTFKAQLKYHNYVDYDVMFIRNQNIMDSTTFENALIIYLFFSEHSFQDQLKKWEEAKFCKHEKEPFIMIKISGVKHTKQEIVEHVGIVQPACNYCFKAQPRLEDLKCQGRLLNVVNPKVFAEDFINGAYTNSHPDEECNPNHFDGEDYNRSGDLCSSCRVENCSVVQHQESVSYVFLDKVKVAGPSLKCSFFIKNLGKSLPEIPLFDKPGVSSVMVDNIPAVDYPALDWRPWYTLMQSAGFAEEKEFQLLRWPYECVDFCVRKSVSGWPSSLVKYEVMKAGCHIVPRTPRKIGEKGTKTWFRFHMLPSAGAWRISFSVSEKILVKRFSQPQRKCFLILKTLLKSYSLLIDKQNEEEYGEDNDIPSFKVSGFILKHTMFWTMERVDQLEWRHNNLYGCINHVLDQFEIFLKDSCIPHYFFGTKKNLIAGDYSFDTQEEGECLKQKMEKYHTCIKQLRCHNKILELIQFGLIQNIFDFQWNINSSLCDKEMLLSFIEMMLLETPSDFVLDDQTMILTNTWKKKLAEHLHQMIRVIKHGPRSYGTGTNIEFLQLLEMEENLLKTTDNLPLKDLDLLEKEALRKWLEEGNIEYSSNSKRAPSERDLFILQCFCKIQMARKIELAVM